MNLRNQSFAGMTAEDLHKRLKGTRKTRNGWEACCPAHEDHNASLSISEGADGTILLKCHAGCDTAEICQSLGITLRDLFPSTTKQPRQHKAGRIVSTYDYTDAAGNLIGQVCRFDPKVFRQRRPDPEKQGHWLWDMNGTQLPIYRLPEITRAISAGRIVFVAEGEKDCDALAALGLAATCNPMGAGKWREVHTEALSGAKVIVIADKDTPGRRHAAAVLQALSGKTDFVRVIELPDRNGHNVKDAFDWIAAGGTREELQKVIRKAPENWKPSTHTLAETESAGPPDKPEVFLPGGKHTISETGRVLGELLAREQRFFCRGGGVVKLGADTDGLPRLDPLKPATLASDFEAVARLRKMQKTGDDWKQVATVCTEQQAKMIMGSAHFLEALPPIHVLTRCPVLIERNGELVHVSGYDRESGIMAGGKPAVDVDIAEGRRLLCELVDGFRFATPADRARALAALITPALVLGGLLRARAPVDLGEADASQSGKGFKVKLKGAVYGETVKVITQHRAGGVGSLEESFNAALIRGACFICLDNVRGKIDSPAFESFLTEDHYTARAAFLPNTDIDPRRVCIMMTSNKADVTTDLANRSSCVRILKQRDGYTFRSYPEGDILDHVRANQPRFLGAVFSVVRAWFEAGRPRTTETRHDFRPWAQALDWITRNLLDAGPLLDGHRETQARMTNPVLNWLRDVALEVIRARQAGAWLRAGDLVDLLAETGTETPGLPEHGDPTDPDTRKAAQQATGRKLGLCFRAGEFVSLDGMTIERRETYDTEGRYTVREYRFTTAAMETESLAARATDEVNPNTMRTPELPVKTPSCGYETPSCGYGAASPAASKTPIAAIAADPLRIGQSFEPIKEKSTNDILTMQTISRIAAQTPPELDFSTDFEEGEA